MRDSLSLRLASLFPPLVSENGVVAQEEEERNNGRRRRRRPVAFAPAVEVGTLGRVEVRERLEDWTLRKRPRMKIEWYAWDVTVAKTTTTKRHWKKKKKKKKKRSASWSARTGQRARHIRMVAKRADGHAEKQI